MTAASPEVPGLEETYFVLNPAEYSTTGLLRVPVVGEELRIYDNLPLAVVIRQALDLTRVDDPQAEVLEALYRGDGIPRDLMDSLQSTITDDHVCLPLRDALFRLYSSFPGVVTLDLDLFRQAFKNNTRFGVVLLNGDGLRVDDSSVDFTQPLLEDSPPELFLSYEERRIARELGASAFAYNMELIWQDTDEYFEPRLLSRRIHLAVGAIAADGVIEHVGTILSPDHPARSG